MFGTTYCIGKRKHPRVIECGKNFDKITDAIRNLPNGNGEIAVYDNFLGYRYSIIFKDGKYYDFAQ